MGNITHQEKLLASIIKDIVACPIDHPYLVATGNSGADCKMYIGDEVVAGIACCGLATFKISDHDGKISNALFLVYREDTGFEHLLLFGDGLAGNYIRIGQLTDTILVVEDIASGLSLNAATKLGVAIAMYSENIPCVVASLRKKYPEKHIIICVGAYGSGTLRSNEPFAIKAATQSSASVALPNLRDHFNDLYQAYGDAHVLQIALQNGVPIINTVFSPPEVDVGVKAPLQWSGPVYGSALMEQLMARFKRHVVLQDHQIVAICLWVILTHLVDVMRVLPILALVSPVRRCGKTTLLEIIQMLVSRGLMSSNITPASLFRTVDEWKPTLIIDEADTFLVDSSELVGIVNAGHTRASAHVYRVGSGNKSRRFNVFCPKLIAGIGHRSPTIMDRSIVITHQRKRQDEHVEKYWAKENNNDLIALRARIARWAADSQEAIAVTKFDLPDLANDRALDNWEPLLAIAACLGDKWLDAATEAAKALTIDHDKAMCSGEELLRDIRSVFTERRTDRIYTAMLIDDLCCDHEKPWSTFDRGRPITPRQIAKLLNDFQIESGDVRIGTVVKKGYQLNDFEDAFARYVPQ